MLCGFSWKLLPNATRIISEVEQSQQKNPASPDWEKQLIGQIRLSTHLLEPAEFANLQHLREHRNLCAHPVLTRSESLYTPTQEQARAHVRNALDGVLTKPPIFTKKVIDALLDDVEEQKEILVDDETLGRYLRSRYLNHLSAEVELQLFRSLWGLVFRASGEGNERCEANREINYRVLLLLNERRRNDIAGLIGGEPAYYSRISGDHSCVVLLLAFLMDNQHVFLYLDDGARALIAQVATKSPNDFAKAWYLSESFPAHVQRLKERITAGETFTSRGAFERLVRMSESDDLLHDVLWMGIELLAKSKSPDMAVYNFGSFVAPYLGKYSRDLMEKLLASIEANRHTYLRSKAGRDFALIEHAARQTHAEAFRAANYPHTFLMSMDDAGVPSGWND